MSTQGEETPKKTPTLAENLQWGFNIIGLIGTMIGVIRLIEDKVNLAHNKGGSVVRFHVGLDTDMGLGLSNAGGDIPDVRLYNEVGDFIGGRYDPGHIDDGTTGHDVRVQQNVAQQATYGLFTANEDAICLAYMTMVWPDEQKFGWMGDWGKECGATWYYSNIVLSGQVKPTCMWIDRNHDQPVTAFQVHFPEFVATENTPAHDKEYYCNNAPVFNLYYSHEPNKISVWTPTEEKAKAKRDAAGNGTFPARRRQLSGPSEVVYSNDTRLVISKDANQSAVELCSHPASLGPDFANVAEGQFCQMATKTLFPVCSSSDRVKDNCFNIDTRKLVIGGISTRDVDYPRVIDWTADPEDL
ncbi:MAG: hypothetical protein M1816_000440 [Peltula sp. TS41687]|nr:MAG: hypothetical protein M1816_000440 [Peltula sp. TS41687]